MRLRIDGMDLSDYQEHLNIQWADAKKAGIRFCYHKATEGTGWTSQAYETRREECAKHGIDFGAYHFAHPAPGNALDEARYFLSFAKPKAGDLLPALDLEVNDQHMSEDELTVWVHTFFEHIFRVIGVRAAVLYTRYNLGPLPHGVKLWVPRFSNANYRPVVPSPFKHWAIWQFSDGKSGVPAAVPGVGHVDIDTIHRLFPWARLSRLRIPSHSVNRKQTPSPAPAPAPTPAPSPAPAKPKRHKENPVARLLRIAGSQVNYHEGRSGGHWDNHQKFSPAVPGLEWSQNQPWCCTFVSWCAMKAGLSDLFPRTASCKAAEAWWKAKNQWSEYPAIGAQVIYGNGEHTGIVYDFDADHVYTIEGNTNTNGSAEGDGVYRKKRLRRDPYVTGYGYPQIPGHRLKTADPNYYARRAH